MATDKKSMSRSEIIQYRLKLMIDMAKAISSSVKASELALKDQYIRIGGEKFMAVSLSDKSPLLGIGNKSKRIDTVFKYLSEIEPAKLSEKDWNSKEERRVQSYIIKNALINDRNLRGCLGLEGYFDELLFCLDEVSLGDNNHINPNSSKPQIVRCDLLAVGLIGGKYFPVLIEFKYKRELTRLIQQLDNFIEDIQDPGNSNIEELFLILMAECSGRSDIKLESEFKKVIVWPRSTSPQKATEKALQDKQIIEVSYDSSSGYKDISKWDFKVNVRL